MIHKGKGSSSRIKFYKADTNQNVIPHICHYYLPTDPASSVSSVTLSLCLSPPLLFPRSSMEHSMSCPAATSAFKLARPDAHSR